MAKALTDACVFRILLDGGYISAKFPHVIGRVVYSVFAADSGCPSGARKAGHITERQFGEYTRAGIVSLQNMHPNTDKAGAQFYYYDLLRENSQNK